MGQRRLTAVVLAAVVAFGGACSAPEAPLEVGVRDVPTDVVIGTRDQGLTATPTTTAVIPPEATVPAGPTAATGSTTTTTTASAGPGPQPVTGITVSGGTTTSP